MLTEVNTRLGRIDDEQTIWLRRQEEDKNVLYECFALSKYSIIISL